jgi:hypothetical protein
LRFALPFLGFALLLFTPTFVGRWRMSEQVAVAP